MSSNKVTIWERFYPPSSDGKSQAFYSHNHIDDGWVENYVPISIYPHVTKDWTGFQWRKTFSYIDKDSILFPIKERES